MNFIKESNGKGNKIYYHYDFGRSKSQHPSTGIFIYAKPKGQIQKNHNKESENILETKKSRIIIDMQDTGGAYIPNHKFKANFPSYFEEYVRLNKRVFHLMHPPNFSVLPK